MSAFAFELDYEGFSLVRRLGTKGKNTIQLRSKSGATLELPEAEFYFVVSQYVERVELEGLSRLDFNEEQAVPVTWCERCEKAVPEGQKGVAAPHVCSKL